MLSGSESGRLSTLTTARRSDRERGASDCSAAVETDGLQWLLVGSSGAAELLVAAAEEAALVGTHEAATSFDCAVVVEVGTLERSQSEDEVAECAVAAARCVLNTLEVLAALVEIVAVAAENTTPDVLGIAPALVLQHRAELLTVRALPADVGGVVVLLWLLVLLLLLPGLLALALVVSALHLALGGFEAGDCKAPA